MVQPKDTNPQDGKANTRLCGKRVAVLGLPDTLFFLQTPLQCDDNRLSLRHWGHWIPSFCTATPTPLLAAFSKQAHDIALGTNVNVISRSDCYRQCGE